MVHHNIDGIYVVGVTKEKVDEVWEDVTPFLKWVINPHEHTLQTVYDHIRGGQMQLWVIYDRVEVRAVFTTEVANHPAGKIATIMHLAGRWHDCMMLYIPELKAWAKSNGATVLRFAGRHGWERKLKEHFEPRGVIMEADL
jgi:hypothetical protein